MTKCFYAFPFFDPQTRERERKLVKEKSKKRGWSRQRKTQVSKFWLFTLKNRKTCSWGHQHCFEGCAILNKQILGFKNFCEYALMNSVSLPLASRCFSEKRIKPHQKGKWLSSQQKTHVFVVFKDAISILTWNVLQTKVPNNRRFLGIVQSINSAPHDKGTFMNVHIIICYKNN